MQTHRWRGLDSNFQYAGAVNLVVAPYRPPNAWDGRCDLSVFGQHDALHQIGVDPTAEAAIRAGDDILAAGDRGLTQNVVGDLRGRECASRA